MFNLGDEHRYRCTARELWEIFSKVHKPVRTKNTPDFNSSYRMLKFLHWCLKNPPQDFSVVCRVEHKTEIFEVRDNWCSTHPQMRARLKGKIPLGTKVLSDEKLWNKVQKELQWEPPPVDLERAERMARFREEQQPAWDNIRERIRFVNEWIRENGILAYIEKCRSGQGYTLS